MTEQLIKQAIEDRFPGYDLVYCSVEGSDGVEAAAIAAAVKEAKLVDIPDISTDKLHFENGRVNPRPFRIRRLEW